MAALFALYYRLVQNPVQLDRAAFALIGVVTVPGIVRPPEDDQGATFGFDLCDVILKVSPAPKDSEPPTVCRPIVFVHIDQNRNDFGLGIGVNLTVALPTKAADSIHGRAVLEVDIKLLFDSFAELVPMQFVDQFFESTFDL